MARPAAALLVLAAATPPAMSATPIAVALAHLDALGSETDPTAFAEQRALARVALDVAGPAVLAPVAARLRDGGAACAVAAWALGVASPEAEAAPAAVVAALRDAAAAGDWDCRVGAAAALGRLGVGESAPDLGAAWHDPARPPGSDGVLLVALAGVGGPVADEALAAVLARGGDESWSRLVIAACLRRGPDAWPMLVDAAIGSDDPSVRATASLALLLLAEPRSGCALAEGAGAEPDPGIRRLQYQALGACRAPSARAFLALAAGSDPVPELRRAAAALSELPMTPPRRPARAGRIGGGDVRAALDRLVTGDGDALALDDVEARATSIDLPALERTLRLLPLRADGGWVDDHARLAQVRARLLCAADPDCEPRHGRVGRLDSGER